MFNLISILPLVKNLAPALLIISEAFRFGVTKFGNGTWKNMTAEYHVQKAAGSIKAWAASPMQYSHLADAGLRLLFALSLVAGKPYVPKEPAVETKPK